MFPISKVQQKKYVIYHGYLTYYIWLQFIDTRDVTNVDLHTWKHYLNITDIHLVKIKDIKEKSFGNTELKNR